MTTAKRMPRNFAPLDDRDLDQIREMGPHYPPAPIVMRALGSIAARFNPGTNLGTRGCAVCGRKSKSSKVFVNPITLRRSYESLCGRQKCVDYLSRWEGSADARRRRAQNDWERENPSAAALDLVGYIPPQYPSVSRATLRKFLDSGAPVATVRLKGDMTITASGLNSSIASLGFADEVYAEIRSDQVVLRRTGAGS